MFLAQASASGTGAMASMLIPLVIFFVLMYFVGLMDLIILFF